MCASPEYSATGRLGKASSSECFDGSTGGSHRYSRQPWASSHPSGRPCAKRFIRSTQPASLSPRKFVASGEEYTAEWKKCTCESWKPGAMKRRRSRPPQVRHFRRLRGLTQAHLLSVRRMRLVPGNGDGKFLGAIGQTGEYALAAKNAVDSHDGQPFLKTLKAQLLHRP